MRGVFVLALLLAACTPAEVEQNNLSATERVSCLSAGGLVQIAGFSGNEFCATRAPDAGKMCRKASDCTVRCEAGTQQCATHNSPFGCHSYLNEQGKEETVCVD